MEDFGNVTLLSYYHISTLTQHKLSINSTNFHLAIYHQNHQQLSTRKFERYFISHTKLLKYTKLNDHL